MIIEADIALMERAEDLRGNSTDKSRKVGCVITDASGAILAEGWNAFPPGVKDIPERHARPAKYNFTEHAERWAVADAASKGTPLAGSTAYVPWFPCCDCGRMLAMSGVSRIVCREPDLSDPTYGQGFADLIILCEEMGVEIDYYPYPDPAPQTRTEDSELGL